MIPKFATDRDLRIPAVVEFFNDAVREEMTKGRSFSEAVVVVRRVFDLRPLRFGYNPLVRT